MLTVKQRPAHWPALRGRTHIRLRQFAPFGIVFLALSVKADIVPLALDITGKISRYTDISAKTYHLSDSDILSMPQYIITTSTSWTAKSVFKGVRLADVLDRVGAYGQKIRTTTYDGYAYTIPRQDTQKYGVILAYERDGKRLTLRDFGPLFVIYPRDAYRAELTNSETESKFVWQVKSLEIQ